MLLMRFLGHFSVRLEFLVVQHRLWETCRFIGSRGAWFLVLLICMFLFLFLMDYVLLNFKSSIIEVYIQILLKSFYRFFEFLLLGLGVSSALV